MARPQIKIDQKQFESLCGFWCTEQEIADFFECSPDTIDRWCKRTYKCGFAETYKKHSAKGRIALRRNQLRLSEKSAAMAIFLGRNYLGQKNVDTPEGFTDEVLQALDKLNGALKKAADDDR